MMRDIMEIYKDGHSAHLIQCLRCKEVFTVFVRGIPSSFDMNDVLEKSDEGHKKECVEL